MNYVILVLRTLLFYYSIQVQPKHVKEAFRLLNKSIIRVEQPDIHFEEEQEDLQNAAEAPMDVESTG